MPRLSTCVSRDAAEGLQPLVDATNRRSGEGDELDRGASAARQRTEAALGAHLKVSREPNFVAQGHEVVGLYLNLRRMLAYLLCGTLGGCVVGGLAFSLASIMSGACV